MSAEASLDDTPHRTRALATGLILLSLLGIAVRLPFFHRLALHSDEYLTLYRSLLISRGDFFLEGDPSQKPPLLYMLIAGLFSLFGEHREIALLVGLASSVILIPATGLLTFTLTRSAVAGLVAGFLVAFSPFQIAFATTAFLDSPMIALGILGLLAAARSQGLWAGLVLGAAVAVKQQAIFFVVLAPALLFLSFQESKQTNRREMIRFFGALVLMGALLLLWSVASMRGALPSFISVQIQSETDQIGAALLINPIAEGFGLYWLRLSDWGRFISLFFGPLGLVAILLSVAALRFRSHSPANSRSLQAIAIWCIAFVLIYTVIRFRIVDRYMLILVPIVACLVGAIVGRWRGRLQVLLAASLLALSSTLGIRELSYDPKVLPQSPGARPRLVGVFTRGSPLSISAVDFLRQKYPISTEIYAHGALFPAVKFEFAAYSQVRNVSWPLRFLNESSTDTERILIWDKSDDRRLVKLKSTLEQGGYGLEAIATEASLVSEPGRLAVFRIMRSLAKVIP